MISRILLTGIRFSLSYAHAAGPSYAHAQPTRVICTHSQPELGAGQPNGTGFTRTGASRVVSTTAVIDPAAMIAASTTI